MFKCLEAFCVHLYVHIFHGTCFIYSSCKKIQVYAMIILSKKSHVLELNLYIFPGKFGIFVVAALIMIIVLHSFIIFTTPLHMVCHLKI